MSTPFLNTKVCGESQIERLCSHIHFENHLRTTDAKLIANSPYQVPAQLTNNSVVACGALVGQVAGLKSQGKNLDKGLASNIIDIVEASVCALRSSPLIRLNKTDCDFPEQNMLITISSQYF